MQEKRRYKRFIVEGMDISGKMMFATEVKVLNISISGASIKADRRLDIGSEYTLKLIDKGRVVSLKGVVVWSSISEQREGPRGDVIPIYSAGMKFVNLFNDRVVELVNFIEDHLEGGKQRLTGLRVNIAEPERVVLNFPSAFNVTKLSFSGMLIESSQALETDQKLPMEMSLPGEEPLRFTGRVASCLHVGTRGNDHYDIGVAFINMAEKDLERLRNFINLLHRMDDIA